MILSIIIITHNQKEQFQKCIESVLAQDLPFEHEIIISDDASTDGTWELAKVYESKSHGTVSAYQCKSDDCVPSMISERAGYNRINGLKHARGKYILHVDGDDFYSDTSCIAAQVDLLENNPECTICCQRYIWLEDGMEVDDGNKVFDLDLFVRGRKLSVDEFVRNIPYIHNSACLLKRGEIQVDAIRSYEYDDVDITYQFISNGPIILSDKIGFVYCHHKSGSASDFQPIGQIICWLTAVSESVVAPQCTGSLLRSGLNSIIDVIHYILGDSDIGQDIMAYLSKSEAFVFNAVPIRNRPIPRLRYKLTLFWLKVIRKLKFDSEFAYCVLYKLLISMRSPQNLNLKRLV